MTLSYKIPMGLGVFALLTAGLLAAVAGIVRADTHVPVAAPEQFIVTKWNWIDEKTDLSDGFHINARFRDVDGEFPEDQEYYFQLAYGQILGANFYFGFQTDLLEGGQSRGRGVIFSRWGSQSADDIQTADGGFSEIGSHEGEFIGVRLPYDWDAGAYTAFLEKEENNWYSLTVRSYHGTDHTDTYIGSLRFPASGETGTSIRNVLEVYGDSTPMKVTELPAWVIAVHAPIIANGGPRPVSLTVDYSRATGTDRVTLSQNNPRLRFQIGPEVLREDTAVHERHVLQWSED